MRALARGSAEPAAGLVLVVCGMMRCSHCSSTATRGPIGQRLGRLDDDRSGCGTHATFSRAPNVNLSVLIERRACCTLQHD
jgi:hypothetical protein